MSTIVLMIASLPFIAILAPYMVMCIYSYPLVGIGGTLLMVAWDALKFSGEELEAIEAGTTAGLNIYPLDLFAVALFVLGMIKVFSTKKLLFEQKLFLAFGFMLLVSFVRGLFDYGLKPAGLELRPYLYWYAIALFVQSYMLNRTSIKAALRIWILLSWSLVALAVVRWGMVLTGMAGGINWVGAGGFELRVLNAGFAIILMQAIVITYYSAIDKKRQNWLMAMIGLFVVVFVLQHRTVWIVAIVSGMAIIIIDRVKFRQNFVVFLSILIPVVIAATLYVLNNPENIVLEFASASVSETTQENSTFAWRVLGWAYLLSPEYLNGITDYLIGKPLGAGYERQIGIGWVTAAAHNHYIQIFVRTGLIGLSLFLFLTYRLISKLRLISATTTKPLANMLFVLLIGQLVYYISYSPGYEQGIWLGLATSVVSWGVDPSVDQQ